MPPESDFELDPRLAAESMPLGELSLCLVRLFDDARFPWLILVPRRPGLVEIIDLGEPDRLQLMREIAHAAETLRSVTNCPKLNIAALGNSVRQLHVHVIARFENDPAWPRPVWGVGSPPRYSAERRDVLIEMLRRGFGFR